MQLAQSAWRPIILTLAVVLGMAPGAHPCSIFMAVDGDTVLAANNEDFYLDVEPKVWVTPGKDGEHGRVGVGFDEGHSDPFAQGGMNDAGLFFDAAVTPKSKEKRIKGKAKAPRNLGDRLLAECATVAEAITWLEQYDLSLLHGGHLLFADATGDGAVVESHDGEMKIFRRKVGNYVGATNFAFADPALGNYPCPRFKKIDDYFKVQHGPVTLDAFRELLASIAVPRTYDETAKRDGGTLYSNVCDLKAGVILLYRESAFDKPVRLEVKELLAKGEQTLLMKQLFK